jgi:hypothetical protein
MEKRRYEKEALSRAKERIKRALLRFRVTVNCLYCLTDLSQKIKCSQLEDLNGNNTNTFIL